MIVTAVVVAAVAVTDPRPTLAELQLAGRTDETLAIVEETIAEEPDQAAKLGLDYLRGHLFERQGRIDEANDAFGRALDVSPSLRAYTTFRLANNWLARGHPEVAAGLFARVLSSGAPPPLADPATDRLIRTLRQGGDCRLLGQVEQWPLSTDRRRRLELARADCAMGAGDRDGAVARLVALIEDGIEDDSARGAAERLSALGEAASASPQTALLIGRVFHRNRLFSLSIRYLRQGLEPVSGDEIASPDGDHLYALARSYFWQGKYLVAAVHFGRLAAGSRQPEYKARALYQQARCYELSGNWEASARSYRMTYLADSDGPWADAALLGALRLEWRRGNEDAALETYGALAGRREWRPLLARAALFLASSDIVRQRPDRAGTWLDQAERALPEASIEVEYWRGRLAEVEGRTQTAVESYLSALTARRFHPFAQAAGVRLRSETLAEDAERTARLLSRRSDASSLFHAWTLLGDADPDGATARRQLTAILARDRDARRFLDISERPTASWPLWEAELDEPEERLLALGVWSDGASAVSRHFPAADVSLAFTGSRLLAQGEEHRKSLLLAEILGNRAAQEVPVGLLSEPFRRLLYPLPWAATIRDEAERHGVEPQLLAALIREESRFDRQAVSGAAARGLTQFVLPTARRLAPAIGRSRLEAEDLYEPEVSIALGAAYLAELAARYGNSAPRVIAAYNAGERQADLWSSYCYSREPEEYLTKVGFPETRKYLERVLISRAEYRVLYPRI